MNPAIQFLNTPENIGFLNRRMMISNDMDLDVNPFHEQKKRIQHRIEATLTHEASNIEYMVWFLKRTVSFLKRREEIDVRVIKHSRYVSFMFSVSL